MLPACAGVIPERADRRAQTPESRRKTRWPANGAARRGAVAPVPDDVPVLSATVWAALSGRYDAPGAAAAERPTWPADPDAVAGAALDRAEDLTA